MPTYEIPAENYRLLKHKIDLLAARALRLGLPGPYIRNHEVEHRQVPNHEPLTRELMPTTVKIIHHVDVMGDVPVIDGWSFVATINRSGIIYSAPGQEVPEDQRDRGNVCDHCNLERIRNDTFVLEHEDGRVQAVGRQCLRYFLPMIGDNPQAIAKFLSEYMRVTQLPEGYGEEMERAPRHEPRYSLDHFLQVVAAIIRVEGWVSRTKANVDFINSTSDQVKIYLAPSNVRSIREWKALVNEYVPLMDTGEIQAAINWAENVEVANDYTSNIQKLAHKFHIEDREFGLAASILPVYRRHVEYLEREANTNPGRYLGEVGDRITVEVEINSVEGKSTRFGYSYLHNMKDIEGNTVVWWASSDQGWLNGDSKIIIGKVKSHSTFRGVNQTILTRCKEVAA